MAFVPVPDTARVTMNFVGLDGGEACNVIYVGATDSPVSLSQMAMITLVVSQWANDHWRLEAASGWTLTTVEALDASTEDGAYVVQNVQVSGTRLIDPLPAMNTIAVQLLTGRSGRSRRGRLYHVGLSEEQTLGNYLTPLAADALIACYDALRTAFIEDELQWRVASFQQDGVKLATAVTYPISNIQLADRKIDRQIRRMYHSS